MPNNYVNQAEKNNQTHDIHDFRIPEITQTDVGKTLVVNEEGGFSISSTPTPEPTKIESNVTVCSFGRVSSTDPDPYICLIKTDDLKALCQMASSLLGQTITIDNLSEIYANGDTYLRNAIISFISWKSCSKTLWGRIVPDLKTEEEVGTGNITRLWFNLLRTSEQSAPLPWVNEYIAYCIRTEADNIDNSTLTVSYEINGVVSSTSNSKLNYIQINLAGTTSFTSQDSLRVIAPLEYFARPATVEQVNNLITTLNNIFSVNIPNYSKPADLKEITFYVSNLSDTDYLQLKKIFFTNIFNGLCYFIISCSIGTSLHNQPVSIKACYDPNNIDTCFIISLLSSNGTWIDYNIWDSDTTSLSMKFFIDELD